jgi:hypothetical protein
MKHDAERWNGIIEWREQKLETPLAPRDFHRLSDDARVHQLAMPMSDTTKPTV